MVKKHLEQITEHVFLVNGNNRGRFPFAHSIFIQGDETVLIDTGCGIDILKELKAEYRIDFVINSHSHIDHCAGNWIFQGKPMYVPAEGFTSSGNLVALSERFVSKQLASIWRSFAREAVHFSDFRPTHNYTEQDSFDLSTVKLTPIYTPGHTCDHYCFFEKQKGILFSFDYDLTSFPWYGHKESNLVEFRASVKKLQRLSPKIVVSSHRGIITENIDDQFEAFVDKLDERSERIFRLLKHKQTIKQLVDQAPIYGKFPYAEPLLRYWEEQMIRKHLKELAQKGRIQQQGKFYFRG